MPRGKPKLVEWVPLESLSPWEGNARKHTDESTRKLAAGIRRFGFLVPITGWREERLIAAGHGRRLALLALLAEDPAFVPRNAPPGTPPGYVPVMWESFGSRRQFEAFAVSDNQQAKNAKDDDEVIASLLVGLRNDGLDFEGLGFSDRELRDLLGGEPASEPAAPNQDDPGVAYSTKFALVVEDLDGEQAQRALFERLAGEGYRVRALSV